MKIPHMNENCLYLMRCVFKGLQKLPFHKNSFLSCVDLYWWYRIYHPFMFCYHLIYWHYYNWGGQASSLMWISFTFNHFNLAQSIFLLLQNFFRQAICFLVRLISSQKMMHEEQFFSLLWDVNVWSNPTCVATKKYLTEGQQKKIYSI